MTVDVDVVIVGAGVAGLVAALDLVDLVPDVQVAVLDKGVLGSSGSTPLAQGGMAAAVGAEDSPALHAADTIAAGDGLCDHHAVQVMAAEAPARVADLVARGAIFDRRDDGALHLAREGGQRVPRSVHTADATGAEIFRALRTAATGRVQRLQGIACQIAVTDGRACGIWAILDKVESSAVGPAHPAGLALIRSRAVVLATGGCGGLFAATTNRDGATADGIALARHAGAALSDLEFVQFHPTGLRPRPDSEHGFWRVLLTEALRGAGAHLVNANGRRFMVGVHPDAELGPRHIVTKGILEQDGGAWLDATHLGAARLVEEFPTAVAGARAFGYELDREPVPVEPAQHYMIGGVATDLSGATSVPGLFAVGETASTGVHGANRMAGNSLAQSCVFGHRAALTLARELTSLPDAPEDPLPPVASRSVDADVAGLRAELRVAMTAGAGPVRTASSLSSAAAALDAIAARVPDGVPGDRYALELRHMLIAARLLVRSALLREESRGTHWRDDAPRHAPGWEGVRLRVQAPVVPYAGDIPP